MEVGGNGVWGMFLFFLEGNKSFILLLLIICLFIIKYNLIFKLFPRFAFLELSLVFLSIFFKNIIMQKYNKGYSDWLNTTYCLIWIELWYKISWNNKKTTTIKITSGMCFWNWLCFNVLCSAPICIIFIS